jgi:hypothetical protein
MQSMRTALAPRPKTPTDHNQLLGNVWQSIDEDDLDEDDEEDWDDDEEIDEQDNGAA